MLSRHLRIPNSLLAFSVSKGHVLSIKCSGIYILFSASGIIVHFISNLERQDLKGASDDREGVAGQDTDDPTEQSSNLPSSCVIPTRPKYFDFDFPNNFLT
jgi:hypothetical protein